MGGKRVAPEAVLGALAAGSTADAQHPIRKTIAAARSAGVAQANGERCAKLSADNRKQDCAGYNDSTYGLSARGNKALAKNSGEIAYFCLRLNEIGKTGGFRDSHRKNGIIRARPSIWATKRT